MATTTSAVARSLADKLPEEVLDMIFEQAAQSPSYFVDTMLSLCLTCRAFLNSARRVLYRDPWEACPLLGNDRARAFWFLRTRQAHPYLAVYVRNMQRLGLATATLHDIKVDFSASAASQVLDPWAWQEELLRLCTNTITLSLALHGGPGSKRLAAPVAKLAVPPKLHFVFPASATASTALNALHTFVDRLSEHAYTLPPNLRLICAASPEGDFTVAARPSYRPEQLSIVTSGVSPRALLGFLPQDLSCLRALTVCLADRDSTAQDVEAFFAGLEGNRLRFLSFVGGGENSVGTSAAEYPSLGSGASLPVAAFKNFPAVTSYNNRQSCGMTVDKLRLLGEASPQLVIVRLEGVCWSDLRADEFIPPESGGLSAGERKIWSALQGFEKLYFVNLGILPLDEHARPTLELVAKAAATGIKVSWQGCVAPPLPDWRVDEEDYSDEEDEEEDEE
ncbi:hypothetical protein JCM10213_003524 [Rhodosporidiobolus nylandii]